MAGGAPHQTSPVPAAAQELINKTTIVYERNVLKVLDAKVGKLELQLNSELEKISSCSGLLEEFIVQPPGSPCSSLRAELDRVRAKRERAYQKFQRQQQLETEIDDSGHGAAAANPPEAAASAGARN